MYVCIITWNQGPVKKTVISSFVLPEEDRHNVNILIATSRSQEGVPYIIAMRLTDAWQHMAVIILSFISLLHLLKQEFYENLILLSLTFPPENIYYHIHHHYSFQWHLCIRKNKSFIYALYIPIFFFLLYFDLIKGSLRWSVNHGCEMYHLGAETDLEWRWVLKEGKKKKKYFTK